LHANKTFKFKVIQRKSLRTIIFTNSVFKYKEVFRIFGLIHINKLQRANYYKGQTTTNTSKEKSQLVFNTNFEASIEYCKLEVVFDIMS
jgi:hypothetical protein